MKRIRFLLITATFLALFAVSLGAAAEKDTLVYSWSSNVGLLNPHMYSPNQMFAQAMSYEPLVSYGDDGVIAPCLAERWEISNDGKIYTFFLRKGVVFSDGEPWNAKAAKMNFDAVMANAPRHAWIGLTNQFEAAEVVDEHTLKLVLKNAYYPTLHDLATIRPFRFLSPAAFPENNKTSEGIKKATGTGPWVLAETRKGEFDLFTRNEKYWGAKPAFAKVLVKVITDSEARMLALETGEIDLVYGAAGSSVAQVGIESFKRLEATGRFESAISRPISSYTLALNSGRGPTADRAVRKAIQHLVDKDLLVRAVFLDMEKKADFLFEPRIPYCNVGLEPYAYDPAKAEALLEGAGWKKSDGAVFRSKDGVELSIDICFVGIDSVQKTVAEALQGELRKAGIRLVLIGEENDSFYKRQKDGEFGMIYNETWGAPYEPHAMVSSMLVPSHADFQAQSGLPMKKELDEKIRAVLISADEENRKTLYREILTTLHDEAVYLPLTYKTLVKMHSKKLTGAEFTPIKQFVPFDRMSWK